MFWRLILALCGAGATAMIAYALHPTTVMYWTTLAISFLIYTYAWFEPARTKVPR